MAVTAGLGSDLSGLVQDFSMKQRIRIGHCFRKNTVLLKHLTVRRKARA